MAEKADERTRPISRVSAVVQNEDGGPDHRLAANAITDRPAGHRANGRCQQEGEQMQLCALHRDAEALDQVEGVQTVQAGNIEVAVMPQVWAL